MRAEQVLEEALGALSSGEWQKSSEILSSQSGLLDEHLGEKYRPVRRDLEAYLGHLAEGERLSSPAGASSSDLSRALGAYEAAAEAAALLPVKTNALATARELSGEVSRRMAEQAQQALGTRAEQVLEEALGALSSGEWQKSSEILSSQSGLLDEHLGEKYRPVRRDLEAYLGHLAEGERLSSSAGASSSDLSRALAAYEAAAEAAALLPTETNALATARELSGEVSRRMAEQAQQALGVRAGQVLEEALGALSSGEWQKSSEILSSQSGLLDEHLGEKYRPVRRDLEAYLGHLAEGERLSSAAGASSSDLSRALGAYEAATEAAALLPTETNALATARELSGEVSRRMAAQAQQALGVRAGQVLEEALGALSSGEWQKSSEILSSQSGLLDEHLGEKYRPVRQDLEAYLGHLAEGERLSSAAVASPSDLSRALAAYEAATEAAAGLPAQTNALATARGLSSEVSQRMAELERQDLAARAEIIFHKVLAGLTPEGWPEAKTLLARNKGLFNAHLEGPAKGTANSLVQVAQHIEQGDRFGALQPESMENLQRASEAYEAALAAASELPPELGISGIAEVKLNQIAIRTAALEELRQRQQASATYDRIIHLLKPAEWEKARSLLSREQRSLEAYLADDEKRSLLQLSAFFKDIDGGDRICRQDAKSLRDLDMAMTFYQTAADKARDAAGLPEIGFIARLKIESVKDARETLQEKMDGPAAAATAPEAGLIRPQIEPVDAGTSLARAFSEFKDGNYESAMNYFKNVYPDQIRQLQSGSKKALKALLAIAPGHRAPIILLTELEALMGEGGYGDAAALGRALNEIQERIGERRGLWAIVPEETRLKMLQQLSELDGESL